MANSQKSPAEDAVTLVHVTTVPISLTFFAGQAEYLREQGIEVKSVSSPGTLLDEFSKKENVETRAVPMAREIKLPRDMISLWRLWRQFRALRPKIVHAHTPKAGLLAPIAARLANVPVVFVSLFGLPQMTQTGLNARILNFTTRVSTRLADRVWCDSQSIRDYVVAHGLCSPDKVFVAGNGSVKGVEAIETFAPGVHETSRRRIRSELSIPEDALVVGFVGRIVRDKGVIELEAAWQSLSQRFPNLHLVLVGPFEERDPVPQEVRVRLVRHPRVHLTGHVSEPAPLYAAMDVVVLPSYREGFPNIPLEAGAMCLPIVATLIPGCTDAVENGVTGTLVPPMDAMAIEQALYRYLSEPALREQHGIAGRERVLAKFRPENVWEGLYQEYEYALKAAEVRSSIDR